MRKKLIIPLLILISIIGITVADSTINQLSRRLANEIYCLIDGSNCDLSGSANSATQFNLYLNVSKKSQITWNITDADNDQYDLPIYAGDEYIWGGVIE